MIEYDDGEEHREDLRALRWEPLAKRRRRWDVAVAGALDVRALQLKSFAQAAVDADAMADGGVEQIAKRRRIEAQKKKLAVGVSSLSSRSVGGMGGAKRYDPSLEAAKPQLMRSKNRCERDRARKRRGHQPRGTGTEDEKEVEDNAIVPRCIVQGCR